MLWDYVWIRENPGESPFCKPSLLEPYFYCTLSFTLPCDRTGPRDVGMAPLGAHHSASYDGYVKMVGLHIFPFLPYTFLHRLMLWVYNEHTFYMLKNNF